MTHIEVELQQLKDRAVKLQGVIDRRNKFTGELKRQHDEAMTAHSAALVDEVRQLNELNAIIAKQEEAIAKLKQASITDINQPEP